MKSICFFLSAFLLSFSLISKAQQVEKPLYLSYEKRLALTYFLAGAGEPEEKQQELVKRLESTLLRYLQTPIQSVTVRSFEEFLKAYQGPWPNSYSVESDLKLLEAGHLRGPVSYRVLTADDKHDPELEKRIADFIHDQNNRILHKTKVRAPMADLSPVVVEMMKPDNKHLIQSLILKGFAKADEVLERQVEVLDKVGDHIASTGKLSKLDPAKRLYIETVIKLYSSRLSLRTKKQIVSSFLGEDLNADAMKKFDVLVMNADPILQKVLQIVAGGSDISGDLNEILKKLQSNIKPVPVAIAKSIIESERNRYQLQTVNYEKPKGGSIAQVQFGTRKTDDGEKKAVIRFIRPEIDVRVQEGAQIFTEIAPILDRDPRFQDDSIPRMAPVMPDIIRSVVDELYQENTKKNQKLGKQIYSREILLKTPGYKNTLIVSVPDVIEMGHGETRLMVQEMVSGKDVDAEVVTFEKVAPHLKRSLIEVMAQIWTEEALFKSGFFHSDLHPGNFLVEVTEPAIRLNLIDFGMVGQITKDIQTNMILLVAGVELKSEEIIAKSFLALREKSRSTISEAELVEKVKERMKRIRSGQLVDQDFQKWVAWGINEGIGFPYQFVNLNRGVAILERALSETNSALTVKEIARRLAIKHARNVFTNIRSKGILTMKDVAKLGWIGLTTSDTAAPALSVKPGMCSKVHLPPPRR